MNEKWVKENRLISKSFIKILKDNKLFKNRASFHCSLTDHLHVIPPKKAKFTFIDLSASIGGMSVDAQNNSGVCVFSELS